jgi:t-SNARE complex subunit (syntaxin)
VAKPDFSEFHNSIEQVNRGFLDLAAGNRDIRTHVQEQSVQLKRIDDQLIRLRESTERNTMEHQELVEDLRSASKLVRGLSTVMIVLMIMVTAMVAFMLFRFRH